MPAAQSEHPVGRERRSTGPGFAVVAAVFLACMVYSAVRTPVPAVNEPHYLSKAKHYWDPDFCRGDFFLESGNAHVVFYQVAGLATRGLSLEQTAWLGRAVALALFAVGWCSLVSRLVPGRWGSFWAVCLFLAVAAAGQYSRLLTYDGRSVRVFDLSGEWIVGGVEGKAFSYAFAFWGMGLWLAGRRLRAAGCAGLAVSFHPVVGVWSVAAGLFATIAAAAMQRWSRPAAISAEPETRGRGDDSPRSADSVSKNLAAAALLVIAALPGLLPALEFVGGGNTKVESDAAYIQVAYRLAHHLDPMDVPWTAYACYAAMALFWFFVRRRAALLPGERWFTWFVAGSVLICLFGLLLGLRAGAIGDMPYWQLRTRLLKFYWFRLADGTVPLAASVGVVALVRQRLARGEVSATGKQSATDSSSLLMSRARCWGLSAIMSAVLAASLFLPSPDRSPPQFTPAQLADWKDVCRWIAAETPEGALFLTPTYGWGFKWYAQRPEFVTYKDVPQDAAGVVEWNNRLIALAAWTSENRNEAGGFRPGALERLQKTLKEHEPAGVDYIVSVDGMLGPFPLPVVYENETCRVYRWNDGP